MKIIGNIKDQLLDLVDLLNLEPSEDELIIELFDRAVCEAREQQLITESEADLYAAYLERNTCTES